MRWANASSIALRLSSERESNANGVAITRMARMGEKNFTTELAKPKAWNTEGTEGDGRAWKQQKEGPEKTEESFVFFGPLGFSSGSDSVFSVSSVVKGLESDGEVSIYANKDKLALM
jgi:hypothetical protein